jgi:hypothetical protein
MNRTFAITLILAAALAGASRALAQGDASAQPDLRYFNVIATNNIFNTSREPGRPDVIRSYRRPERVEFFTLAGTMTYDKGTFAFFNGSRSEYREALKAGDTIAGYKIASITHDSIQLGASGNRFLTLKVGAEMRRENGGPWGLLARAESFDSSETASSVPAPGASPSSDTSNSPPNPPSGPDSDVIRRLMLRRAQEK